MDKISRRQFFRLGPRKSVQLSMDASKEDPKPKPPVIRPPGALADPNAFLSACTACGKCTEACPFDTISTLGPEAGRGEGSPVLTPDTKPCRWCDDMPCIQACSDGALVFNEQGGAEPIALAHLDMDHCLNRQGILCDDCVTVCPSNIHAITFRDHEPHLDESLCVGCGLCVLHCPAEPIALRLLPLES